MNQCLFCKIGAGEIQSYTIFENEDVRAFLDIHPCSKGHTVVIPKKHFSEIGEMNEEEWLKVMNGLRETISLVDKKLKPGGMNIGINNRPPAGQAVLHVHWHIIPREEKDGGGSMHSIVRSDNTGDVAEVAKMFK